MTASDLVVHNDWRREGAIAPGATVLDIAVGGPGQVWLATTAGIWQGGVGHWRPPGRDLPLRATALAAADGLLLAGGVPSGLHYSRDDGCTWSTAWIDETTSGVTCFAVSPDFAHDRVLLAGTAGAGILRSTDGGRYWHLTNVGLTDFNVLVLAVAPSWSPREIVFAATDDGVYRSPNGGRAWKRADRGLEGVYVQTLAVSPAFATDATVYAGTEEHGIYRTVDGGDSWQPLAATTAFEAVNALWPLLVDGVPVLIAGTADGTLLRSTDGGESWSVAAEGWPVLVLAGVPAPQVPSEREPSHVYAGLDDSGLLFSDDAGISWQQDDQLAARDITRVAVGDDGALLAFGPAGGVWYADDVRDWRLLADLADMGTLFALLCRGAGWFAATDAGLLRSDDDGASWQLSLTPPDSRISVIASSTGSATELWAGAADGVIWYSDNSGQQWHHLATVASGQPLVALDLTRAQRAPASPARRGEVDTSYRLIAATFDPVDQCVTLWRSIDGGARWELWLSDSTSWSRVVICQGEDVDKDTWVSVGARLWQWDGTDWQPHDLDETPLVGLLHLPGTATHVAATARSVYVTSDGHTWAAIPESPGGLIDLALTTDSTGQLAILGLEPGGIVWQLPLGGVNAFV